MNVAEISPTLTHIRFADLMYTSLKILDSYRLSLYSFTAARGPLATSTCIHRWQTLCAS